MRPVQKLVDHATALRPDVILLDASLRNGLTLARELRRLFPAVRIVEFGVMGEDEGILACAEAGMAGFVASDGTAGDIAAVVTTRCEASCTVPPASRASFSVG